MYLYIMIINVDLIRLLTYGVLPSDWLDFLMINVPTASLLMALKQITYIKKLPVTI